MKNQFGRSMIEMLGVLAIIGVLSIGGIAIFQYAMAKNKANKVIYDINLLREQTLTNAADVPAENFEPESGYQMSSRYGKDPNTGEEIISIHLNNVDSKVCEILLRMKFEDLQFFNLETNKILSDCDGIETFGAIFGRSLGDDGEFEEIDENDCIIPCDERHECHNRSCCPKLAAGMCSVAATSTGCPSYQAPDGTSCGTNQVCEDGECVCGLKETDCLADGKKLNSSTCSCACDGNWSGENCDICDPNILDCGDVKNLDLDHCLCICEDKGYTGYTCNYECPAEGDSTGVPLSKEACYACPNAVWQDGMCYHCTGKEKFSYLSSDDAMECVDRCSAYGAYYSDLDVVEDGYLCIVPQSTDCPTSSDFTRGISKDNCLACSDKNGFPTFWSNGTCLGCDAISIYGGAWFPDLDEAYRCSLLCEGLMLDPYRPGVCFPDDGYEDKYCPEIDAPSFAGTNAECLACASDEIGKTILGIDGLCYSCGYPDEIPLYPDGAKACVETCKGTDYPREIGIDGYSCLPDNCPSSTSVFSYKTKSACEACDNSVWSPIGGCYGCGYSGSIPFNTEAEAKACENACTGSNYERIAEGNYCLLSSNLTNTCPKIDGYVSNVSKSACLECEDSFWKGGVCYGCGYSSQISFNTNTEAKDCENACAGSEYKRDAENRICYPPIICPEIDGSVSNISKSACLECADSFWNDGVCYGCGYSEEVYLGDFKEKEALECENACAGSQYKREGIARSSSDFDWSCRLAAEDGECPKPEDGWANGTFISKSACEACENSIWTGTYCMHCDNITNTDLPSESLAKACAKSCQDRYFDRDVFSPFYFYCSQETRHSCPSATTSVSNVGRSCENCINENGVQTIWTVDGKCYGCGYSGGIVFESDEEAERCAIKCSSTNYPRVAEDGVCYRSINKNCPLPVTTYTADMSKSDCQKCSNSFWAKGNCYGCASSENIAYNSLEKAEECASRCENTAYPREVDKSGDVYYCNRK